MPVTVIFVDHAVNVEPTTKLFALARSVPRIATSASLVAENDVPFTISSVLPPKAPPTSAVPGLLVPTTRTGGVKPPPNC